MNGDKISHLEAQKWFSCEKIGVAHFQVWFLDYFAVQSQNTPSGYGVSSRKLSCSIHHGLAVYHSIPLQLLSRPFLRHQAIQFYGKHPETEDGIYPCFAINSPATKTGTPDFPKTWSPHLEMAGCIERSHCCHCRVPEPRCWRGQGEDF